jgi:hypothetical protein
VRTIAASTSAELRVDAAGSDRQFHPFLYPVHTLPAESLSIVMVPRRWTVRRGVYAGLPVEVFLDKTMGYPPVPGVTYFNVRIAGPDELSVSLSTVLDDVLPLQVTIDHNYPAGAIPFTPADTAELWRALRRMEAVFGRDLFDPVVADAAWLPSPSEPHPRHRTVRVRRRPGTLANAWLHSSGEQRTLFQDLGGWAAGEPFTSFTIRHFWIDAGEILIGNIPHNGPPPMGWAVIYSHEMMHILGVGHTSNFPTPMGPGMRTEEPSIHDVAYMEMKQAVMLLQQEFNTFLGIVPGTIGERRIMLGLPALPSYQSR